MKTNGRADTKGLTGPELANRALTAKEKAEKAEQRLKEEKRGLPRLRTMMGSD
jgi:hypothetical protein